MQTATGLGDKGQDYYFVYLENEKIIIVWKGGKFHYLIDIGKDKQGNRTFNCLCPGAFNRWRIKSEDKRCRHEKFAMDEAGFNFNREVKPKGEKQTEDEYYRNWFSNYKQSFKNGGK